jgi:hypothetical protein
MTTNLTTRNARRTSTVALGALAALLFGAAPKSSRRKAPSRSSRPAAAAAAAPSRLDTDKGHLSCDEEGSFKLGAENGLAGAILSNSEFNVVVVAPA